MEKFKVLITPLIIILAGVLIALAIIFFPQIIKKWESKTLSPQEAGEKVLKYFDFYAIKNNDKVTLIDVKEESGVYKFKLKVAGEEFETFVTKDGKFLFVGFVELNQIDK